MNERNQRQSSNVNTISGDSEKQIDIISNEPKKILKKPTPPIKSVNKKPILKTKNNKTHPKDSTESQKTQAKDPTKNNKTQAKDPTESPKTQQQEIDTTNTQKKRQKKRKNQKESPWSTLHFYLCLKYLEIPFAAFIYLQQWSATRFKRPKKNPNQKNRGRRRPNYFAPVHFRLCLEYLDFPFAAFIYLKKWHLFKNKDHTPKPTPYTLTNEEERLITLTKELEWRTAHMSEIQTMLNNLYEKFPKAFIKDPKKIKPLKLGINEDLIVELGLKRNFEREGKKQKRLIYEALKLYTEATEYVIKIIKRLYRIDLNGKRTERVSETHAEMAQTLLEQLNLKPDSRSFQKWLELWKFYLLLIILPQKYLVIFHFLILNFTPFTNPTINFENWYQKSVFEHNE